MHYNSIEAELGQEFPELSEPIQRFYDSGESGAYILFEGIFRIYIAELLACQDSPGRDQKLRQVFRFAERMLESGGEVENLAFISIFEGQSGCWLRYAKPFLGPRAEEVLDRFDSEWRLRSLNDPSKLETSDAIDLYGVRVIAESVCATA